MSQAWNRPGDVCVLAGPARQAQQLARDRQRFVAAFRVRRHTSDIAAGQRVCVNRGVEEHGPILRAGAAEAVADAERHLADGAGRCRGQRAIRRRLVEPRERHRRGEVFEQHGGNCQPLQRRRAQSAAGPADGDCDQDSEREVHANHRPARYTRVFDKGEIAGERLGEPQSAVEARNRQERPRSPQRENRGDAPPYASVG